jgi:hypothetical protein
VLFLYRPRQTWMPYTLPRHVAEQTTYNREMQQRFDSTHRVPPAALDGSGAPADPLAQLRELADLHAAGALDDAEFAAAKRQLLGD